jgi:hypothetical protein
VVTTETTKVYVLNKGPHNYSAAEHYGELVYCTDGALDRSDVYQMYRELQTALEDSIPEDYLVITSLASLCGIACAIFAEKHHRLNLLIHKDGGYRPFELYFN